jgi:SAM-dependent methyltransferase
MQFQRVPPAAASDADRLSSLLLAKKAQLIQRMGERRVADIGSGKWGSFWEYCRARVGHVIGIEPNEGNLRDGLERLGKKLATAHQRYRSTTQFTSIAAAAEQTDEVLALLHRHHQTERVDFVSSFLSMTFFFETESKLDALLATVCALLKPGGTFVGVTLDGAKLHQTVLRDLPRKATVSNSVFSLVKMYENDDNAAAAAAADGANAFGSAIGVHFHKPNAIVQHQLEYLTHFPAFCARAEKAGLQLVASALVQEDADLRQIADAGVRAFAASHRLFAFRRV